MSLSRLLPVLLCFGHVWAAHAAPLRCPASMKTDHKILRFEALSVFDGEPSMRVDLMPDTETSTWSLEVEQQEAKKAGRKLYMVCRYRGTEKTVQLPIPYEFDECAVRNEGTRLEGVCAPRMHGPSPTAGRE